jgi:uncharacterized membrane protein
MTSPAVFWPSFLGWSFLAAGIWTYRRDVFPAQSREGTGFVAFGPVFVAAPLACFAGEHFTAARSLAQIVPAFMPAKLFIAYFVGAALLAAAVSFVARRCLRWSTFFLALMFALFVLLMDIPASVEHPKVRLFWSLAARQTTYSIGALAFFATIVQDRWPKRSIRLAAIARVWMGIVLIFYGAEHILYPQYSPGVPDDAVTASWVPLPHLLAYFTGVLLIAFGAAMFAKKYSVPAAALAGLLMLLLTLGFYLPEIFLARTNPQKVTAINFIFDTLLFAGMPLLVAKANIAAKAKPLAISQSVP